MPVTVTRKNYSLPLLLSALASFSLLISMLVPGPSLGYLSIALAVIASTGTLFVLLGPYRGAPPGGDTRSRQDPLAGEVAHSVREYGPTRRGGDGLDNFAWLALVEDVIELVDELDRVRPDLPPSERDLATHVMARCSEILERRGVEVIRGERALDPARHQPADSSPPPPAGSVITDYQSPGFAVGNRILRRAVVSARSSTSEKMEPGAS